MSTFLIGLMYITFRPAGEAAAGASPW